MFSSVFRSHTIERLCMEKPNKCENLLKQLQYTSLALRSFNAKHSCEFVRVHTAYAAAAEKEKRNYAPMTE